MNKLYSLDIRKKVLEMYRDICFIPYEETFGNRDRYQNWWQPSLINWDMSLAVGGEK